MRALVGCEYSGRVRDALIAAGIEMASLLRINGIESIQPVGASHLPHRPNPNGSHEDRAMAKRPLPSPEVLRQLFHYDPETGKLFWKERPREYFVSDKGYACWNGKNAGKEAFTTVGSSGYHEGRIFGMLERSHRVIIAIHEGRWPAEEVDHINGDRTDNRILNLRVATRSENASNVRRRSDNTSGHMGITYWPTRDKWNARITVRGKTHSLGYYSNKSDAIAARKEAEVRHGFSPNHGREL